MTKAKQNTELKDKDNTKQGKSYFLKNDISTTDPLKITIELIIRSEPALSVGPLNTPLLNLGGAISANNCPDNEFAFSFETENATIDHLTVENYQEDNPSDSGTFTTCVNHVIAGEGYVLVIVEATKNTPGGRAALTLKFRGKNIFNTPAELNLQPNGRLRFAKSVKLPHQ